jgi:mycothiol synthase
VRLPEPFTARPATRDDATAIAAVFNACDAVYVSEPDRIGEREVGLAQERAVGAVVVCDDRGEVVAYGNAVPRDRALWAESAVAPTAAGRGIGSFLLDWAEQLARDEHMEALRVSTLAGDGRARALVRALGLEHVRSFYRMVIDLDGPPPAPSWPEGITILPLEAGEERLLHEVFEETFAEHWGHVRREFDEWRRGAPIEHDLTFLAREGDEVAGVVVCHEDLYGVALVGTLGVRKHWRGRGLGRALLLQGFAALYGKGKRRIGLGVDAGNETGAVALYEGVGMRIAGQEDVYEKRL